MDMTYSNQKEERHEQDTEQATFRLKPDEGRTPAWEQMNFPIALLQKFELFGLFSESCKQRVKIILTRRENVYPVSVWGHICR